MLKTVTVPRISRINVNDVEVGSRFREDLGDLTSLKESIAERGLINPITLVSTSGKAKPALAAGGRRLAACKELGLTEVDCVIFDGDEYDLRVIELYENIHRSDLTWAERVKLGAEIDRLQKSLHPEWTTSGTAELLGVHQQNLAKDIELAEALEVIPELAECKSAHEARRTLSKMHEAMVLREISKRGVGKLDLSKQKLCKSYIIGDFFKVSKSLPKASFDLIDLDPPYGIEYDEFVDNWDEGWEDWTEKSYSTKFAMCATECYRLLSPIGWMIVWLASRTIPVTIPILESVGFHVWKVPGIWVKNPGSCLQPKVQLKNSYEPFVYCHKGDGSIFIQGTPNVFHYSQPTSEKIHRTEKPLELMTALLNTFGQPGTRVLVPFAGSGNTLRAAHELKMSCIGYDLVSAFRDKFVAKIMEVL